MRKHILNIEFHLIGHRDYMETIGICCVAIEFFFSLFWNAMKTMVICFLVIVCVFVTAHQLEKKKRKHFNAITNYDKSNYIYCCHILFILMVDFKHSIVAIVVLQIIT